MEQEPWRNLHSPLEQEKERMYWYWMSRIEIIGKAARDKLAAHFKSMREVFEAKPEQIKAVLGVEKQALAILDPVYRCDLEDQFHKLRQRNIYFVTRAQKEFPERLKEIPDGPDWLFYRGNLPDENLPSVAIIGARECSVYGRAVAEMLALELAGAGVQVISGMARGIDGYAQRAALKQGRSFAVLGNGVDICYPMENYSLYEQLPAKGGLISEYAPGSKGIAWHFPCRNRIISGLSDALIVVEARRKSGTLITVEHALAQGREVFAVPGRIGEELSEGCNDLIAQGAMVVTDTAGVLEVLARRYHYENNQKKIIKNKFYLEQPEKMVYANLRLEPKHVEELLGDLDYSLPELAALLFSMEQKGVIYSPAQNYYARVGPDVIIEDAVFQA